MSRLNYSQELIVAIAAMIAAFLSIVGSGWISYNILRYQRYKGSTYHRLLLGTCITDFASSVGWFLTPWAPPQESSPRYLPIGNITSCVTQAYLAQVGAGFVVYNACLSLYYVMTIRYNVTETIMARREPYMHCISLFWGFVVSFIPIPMELYNEMGIGGGCWLGRFPQYCDREGSTIPCTRGTLINPNIMGYIIAGFPAIISLIVVIVCNRLIYLAVKSRSVPSSSPSRSLSITNDRVRKRTEAIASQATWYVIIFVNTVIWQMLLRVLDGLDIITDANESSFTPLIVLAEFFSGFSGFGFLLVYIRPRYIRYRSRNLSRMSSLVATLTLGNSHQKETQQRAQIPDNAFASDNIPIDSSNQISSSQNCSRIID